jgi:DNA-binding HxlR family transcriptional regulator
MHVAEKQSPVVRLHRLVALEALGDGRVGPLLRALEGRSRQPAELERWLPAYPHSTLITRLVMLQRLGVLDRVSRRGAKTVRYGLTASGVDLLEVANTLDAWSERAAYGDEVARPSDAMAKALVAGWGSGIMSALSAGPTRRGRLAGVSPQLTHHQLESRLRCLLRAGLVERLASARGGGRIALTSRGREAMGPVLTALAWDRAHGKGAAVPTPAHVASALVVGFPLAVVSPRCQGLVTLTISDSARPGSAVLVRAMARDGRVDAEVGVPDGDLDGWAHGEIAEWADTLVRGRREIHVAGEPGLVIAILNGLRDRLFPE